MGKYQRQTYDMAFCVCHNEPAVLEEDNGLHFWLCQVDDIACEVDVRAVF